MGVECVCPVAWVRLHLKWAESTIEDAEDAEHAVGEPCMGEEAAVPDRQCESWEGYIQFKGDDKVLKLSELTVVQEMMLENGRPYIYVNKPAMKRKLEQPASHDDPCKQVKVKDLLVFLEWQSQ